MKRFSLCILVLGMLFLCACSASDSSEADISSGSEGIQSQESGDTFQTELKNILESQDPAKTDSETSAVSDRNENSERSKPSASPKEPEESAPANQQANVSKPGENSQAPAGSSEPKQNESAKSAKEPEAPAGETAAEPMEEPPAVTQELEPVVPEEPIQPPAEPEKPKSIYDFAFDADAIRSELIAIGQSMGLTHITEDDGIPCTPDTCSWAAPVTASESFQGDNLKRALQNYVTSMPSTIASYGGTQLTSFTIYVQDNGGGSYTFYFLY